MKIILILLDGLGDRSHQLLGGKTPLQAAKTPHLDRLASLGSNGLFHASVPGECLPSEIAHHLLFGYRKETFPGRGLLEAVGASIPFDDEDVLSLAHLSFVRLVNGTPTLAVSHKDIDLEPDERDRLYQDLSPFASEGIRIELHQTYGNNAILVAKGTVSPFVSDSDPMLPGCSMAHIHPLKGAEETEASVRTARALNTYLRYAHRVLNLHPINQNRLASGRVPANFLATQRCGRRIPQEPFALKWGLRGLLIASGALFGGLAQELGMSFARAEDGTDPAGDLRDRIRLALEDVNHDFIHIHTKAPDEAAHRGDPSQKKEVIEALDQAFDEILETLAIRDDLLLTVTSDHSTPSRSRLIHSGEPVPLTVAGPGVRRDNVRRYDEISASGGCLGLLRGRELMLTLLNYADRSSLSSHCLGPIPRPYFRKDYPPFKIEDPEGN